MLIEFTVKNFKSIKEEQSLSMVRGHEQDDAYHSSDLGLAGVNPLLHAAVIYGANASGKSNLIHALRVMQDIVEESARWQVSRSLPVTPFLLDEFSAKEATEFEVSFIADGIHYQYGFAATKQRITEEWLFASPNGRAQNWFNRAWDEAVGAYQWKFGKLLAGSKQLWQLATRDNALFLSTAVQLNSKQLQPVFAWFDDSLKIITGNILGSFSAHFCLQNAQQDEVLKFLQAADFDIAKLHVQEAEISEDDLPSELPPELRSKILKSVRADRSDEDGPPKFLRVKTAHKTVQGNFVDFKLQDESDGTQKFFALAGPFLNILQNGLTVFVDELHASLHPKLLQFLIALFHDKKTNPKHAQLIFTTHDISVLNQDVFRRDQVWFVEKGRAQASKLFPLSDFHPRKGREDLAVSYIDGRYGALPSFGDFEITAH